jgi:zinc/manganese transport system substrate-binding protein
MRTPILTLLLLAFAASAAKAELRVVTTTTDLAALVEIIGGEHAAVEALCRGYQDPHYLEAKPSHMNRLRRADLLVYIGLELEVGWLPLLVDGSRNPKLRSGNPGHLNASDGLTIHSIQTGPVSRSQGDVHPLGNPHYWLDPRNQPIIASAIAERLSELDPENAATFASNLTAFQVQMREAIAAWEKRLAGWKGRKIVCYHQQWEYLLSWLGIEVMDYIENKPGIPPSPRHIAQLRESMAREQIPLVLISNFFEPAHAERVAEASEAHLTILPASVDGEDGLEDPFLYFEYIVSELENALPGGRID